MSGSFDSMRWNVCVHRPDLGLYSHPKVGGVFFWGGGGGWGREGGDGGERGGGGEWSQKPC